VLTVPVFTTFRIILYQLLLALQHFV